ncbi:hypothetical protein MMC11_005616 [Xylographa trunciseda]|nr:hypothetical protein [Xylographa trunciseda]
MAFGIGIGDVLTLINGTMVLCKMLRDAPAELQSATKDVEQMQITLKVLGEALDNRRSLLSAQPAIASMIQNDLAPLKENLSEMDGMLNDFIHKPTITILGRVRHVLLDRSRLQDIRSNFTRYRSNFASMLDLLNMKANEQNARDHLEEKAMLNVIHSKQAEGADARKAEAAQREKSDAKIETILQILEKRLPTVAPSVVPSHPDQFLKQLEIELLKLGLSHAKIQEVRLDITKALSQGTTLPRSPNSSPLNPHLNSDPKRQSNIPIAIPLSQKPAARYEAKATPLLQEPVARYDVAQNTLSQNSKIDPGATANPPSQNPAVRLDNTKDSRILCVDSSNSIRSVLAQVYLEIMRIWTANATGRWLFKRVDSAGRLINNAFTLSLTAEENLLSPASHIKLAKATIQAIEALELGTYYQWTGDHPNEVERLLERTKQHDFQGIDAADFGHYNFILCFTQHDADELHRMQKASGNSWARIVFLRGCEYRSTLQYMSDRAEMEKLLLAMKVVIKQFISEHLDDGFESIQFATTKGHRTLQIIQPLNSLNFAGFREPLENGPKLKEYETKTGCAIKVTARRTSSQALISIIGPKERLAEAEAMVTAPPADTAAKYVAR